MPDVEKIGSEGGMLIVPETHPSLTFLFEGAVECAWLRQNLQPKNDKSESWKTSSIAVHNLNGDSYELRFQPYGNDQVQLLFGKGEEPFLCGQVDPITGKVSNVRVIGQPIFLNDPLARESIITFINQALVDLRLAIRERAQRAISPKASA